MGVSSSSPPALSACSAAPSAPSAPRRTSCVAGSRGWACAGRDPIAIEIVRSGLPPDVAIRALDRAGDIVTRADVELAEDAAQVSLDGLDAEEEFVGDLEIRTAVDDETRDLGLALGERLDAGAVERARPCATVHVAAQLAELLLGLLAVADRAAG